MFSGTGYIAKREFTRIFKKRTYRFLYFAAPLALLILFAFIYKNERIEDVPIAVVDLDNSYFSRMTTRYFDSAPTMQVARRLSSIPEIKKEMQKGNIQAAVFIPEGTWKSIKEGKSANIVFYKNSQNLVVGNSLLKDGLTILKTVSGGVLLKKLKSAGLEEDQAMGIINPVSVEINSLYNPQYSYQAYLTPGLIIFTLQVIIMLGGALTISSELEDNTYAGLLISVGGNYVKLLIGKAGPHITVNIVTALIIAGVFFPLFNIPLNGSFMALAGGLVLLVISSFMPALFISTLSSESLFATEIALFFNTPAFLFSGLTFPLWGSPEIHKLFALVFPFTHFLDGFLKILSGIPYYFTDASGLALLAFIIIPFAGALVSLKIRGASAPKKVSHV